jgi:DNA-binding transcriptional ArsR family regulator
MIIFTIMNVIEETSIENQPYEAQAQWLKLLTHPVRLAILNILRDGEHCVCHMEAHLGFRQAYISQQIAVLREAGLIQDRRDGWNIFYHVADPKIYAVLDAVQLVLGESSLPHAKTGVRCPCPQCNS